MDFFYKEVAAFVVVDGFLDARPHEESRRNSEDQVGRREISSGGKLLLLLAKVIGKLKTNETMGSTGKFPLI